MKQYVADFETTTKETDCRVWCYGLCEIGNTENFSYGNDLTEFFKFLEKQGNLNVYFHKLKFDGEFILIWLF